MIPISINTDILGSHYPNGNWKSQNFCDKGSRSGYQVTWYENGNIKSSGNFENNKPTGLHTLWFFDGIKRAEINYKNGRRNGEFTFWHSNGQIKFQGSYFSGQVVGIWTTWHSNGQKYKETDTIKGTRLNWYDNGQMRSRQYRISFIGEIEDNEHSPNRNWDLDGNPINGEIVEIKDQFEYWNKQVLKIAYKSEIIYLSFNKDGIKELAIDYRWSPWSYEGDDEYIVIIYKYFDNTGELAHSVRLYDHRDELLETNSWCFYNANDELIYKYTVDQNTYKDIDLYNELLKVENKELNKILVKVVKDKWIFHIDNESDISEEFHEYIVCHEDNLLPF